MFMQSFLCALVQVNTTVGALKANADKLIEAAKRAAAQGAQVIVFPELALSGYPPEDLILKRHFLADVEAQLARMAAALPVDRVVMTLGHRLWTAGGTNTMRVLTY